MNDRTRGTPGRRVLASACRPLASPDVPGRPGLRGQRGLTHEQLPSLAACFKPGPPQAQEGRPCRSREGTGGTQAASSASVTQEFPGGPAASGTAGGPGLWGPGLTGKGTRGSLPPPEPPGRSKDRAERHRPLGTRGQSQAGCPRGETAPVGPEAAASTWVRPEFSGRQSLLSSPLPTSLGSRRLPVQSHSRHSDDANSCPDPLPGGHEA